MKKISVNKDDCSFENKLLFKDLAIKAKALSKSIYKNSKQTFILGGLIGCIIFSGNQVYKFGKDVVKDIGSYNSIQKQEEETKNSNDEALETLIDDTILVGNFESSKKQKYYLKHNNLYDLEGNIISLDNTDKKIYFVNCNIDDTTFENTHLSSSKTKVLNLDMSSIDDNFYKYLPSTLEELSLNRCNYITNLDNLAKKCPNITGLSLNAMASLSDLSFIYELSNLKEIYIKDSAYITEELLNYLKDNNITTNITDQDVINNQKINEIISNIIKPNMSDREKIQAVCLYVLDNIKYDSSKMIESNKNPLTLVLESGKGVCASYAYFTNILLNKANIKSFEITNSSHGWNIIKLDDKYYYIDTTNMDNSAFYNFLLKTLNITKFYMIDTNNTLLTSMSKPTSDTTIIPTSLINDILKGRSNKDIFEKYSGQIGNFGVFLATILAGITAGLGPLALAKLMKDSPTLYNKIKYDYIENKEDLIKNKSKHH